MVTIKFTNDSYKFNNNSYKLIYNDTIGYDYDWVNKMLYFTYNHDLFSSNFYNA